MDSDTDHFESADEEFTSDYEEDNKHSQKNVNKIVDNSSDVNSILEVKSISLENSNKDVSIETGASKIEKQYCQNEQQIEEKQENCNINNTPESNLENNTSSSSVISHNKNNANITKTETKNHQKQKPRVIERRERPQKQKEPKAKLGTKLGTKITENKDETFWGAYTEAKKNEYSEPPQRVNCWEEDVDWDAIETDTNQSESNIQKSEPANYSNLYSEKFTPDKNFWENEEDYMELPREEKKDITLPEIASKNDSSNSWSSWGNWGVSSLLSTAHLGVSTITNSVSQGITTVLETGIGVPDPEELARLDREENRNQKDQSVKEVEMEKPQESQSQKVFGLGNLVSGVTHITKLVETTGTKVLTGGLDTLEVIGKKTMEVLQEGDPGLKKKRALFKIDQNKPVLSHILREAKEKAEQENKFLEEKHFARKPHYETMFDDYQGLIHLEALEMLSKQCDIKLETLLETLTGSALTDMQETMAQIKELCELPDEEEDTTCDIESVREKVENAVLEMNIQISYNHFLESWTEIDEWLEDSNKTNEDEIHQKAIESLAQLTAIAVEQFHKAGELLLIKERRSTVDEADSLVQLTITLSGVIGAVAGKFSEKLNGSNSDNINNLITNIFLEAANSSSYIQDAFNLMIPVLQVGAV